MRRNFIRTLASLGLFAATVAAVPAAHAQTFPSKPVRVIVPATPGGTSDIFARAIATKLSEQMGVPVLVEYKPGASTNIATDYVAKAPADGYTVLINGITLAVNPALYPALPFNPAKDLAPVIEVAEMTNILTVNPASVPAKSLKELVAYMKAQPDSLNYGSTGVGSSSNLAGELFALKTGTKLTHIAYQGNAQVTTDHIGGTLQMGFINMPVGLPFVKSGKLRALAVTGSRRSALLPDVPTVAEALGTDYELTGWFGLMVPAGTPAAVIARLHAETEKALKDPGVRSIISTAGGDIVGGSTAAFASHLKSDTARLTEVIRVANISVK